MLIAQITDTHIRAPGRLAYRQVDTAACLSAAVASLQECRAPLDAVIVTGDLVDAGTEAEYDHYLGLMAPLRVPVFALPGNHDTVDGFRRAFAARLPLNREGDNSYAVDIGEVRLAMLDSTVPGQSHGLLSADRARWLDATLAAAPERPTLLALHHPPFETGIRHMDIQNCHGSEALQAILLQHPQVLAVVSGHVHRSIMTTFAGRTASIAPSTAHAVSLDLDPEGPPAFQMEPPGYHLHVVAADGGPHGRIVTHRVPIGRFAGPFPFFEPDGRLID